MKTQLELELEPKSVGALSVFESLSSAEIYAEIDRRERQTKAAKRIRFPADTMAHLRPWANENQEHFFVLCLDGAHEVIGKPRVVTVGLVNRTIVHPREVFAPAIEARAAAIVIAHNHPSGNTEPSNEDRDVTRRLHTAGQTLGIPVLDSIVFSNAGYYSFLEQGDL